MPRAIRVALVDPFTADDQVGRGLQQCWLDVSNAGGAVGFPLLPVSKAQVSEASRRLEQDAATGSALVFVAELDSDVVGWVSLRLNRTPVARHWATVERLQSRPETRALGIATRLMQEVVQHAHSIGLEHLRLLLRGGENLEVFYSRLGWTEIGRHPQALRISNGDDRDEVSMVLRLPGD